MFDLSIFVCVSLIKSSDKSIEDLKNAEKADSSDFSRDWGLRPDLGPDPGRVSVDARQKLDIEPVLEPDPF